MPTHHRIVVCCATFAVAGLALQAAGQESITTTTGTVITAPISVDQDPPVSACPAGRTNAAQEGFDEQQGVTLTSPLEIDPGGCFLDGITVDSHMIFFQTGGASASDVSAWCFDGLIVGVMSDSGGLLEAASNSVLGASSTCYPGAFSFRGLEATAGDGYVVRGSTIEVTMNVSAPGDWIRIVTEPKESSGVTFSLDHGPTIGTSDPWCASVIGAGDILTVGSSATLRLNDPVASAPAPGVFVDESGLHLSGANIDALSFGHDEGDVIVFSVAEASIGCPGIPSCTGPSDVWLEGYCPCAPVGPVCMLAPGTCSAAGMIFTADIAGAGNTLRVDQSELGLVNAAAAMPPVDDDVDALDLDTTSTDAAGRIYFSLDSASAGALGFSGADILVIDPCDTSGPRVYASAAQLRLTTSDDVDAMALFDDGDGVFNPPGDQILFSVRRGSPVIGQIECNPVAFTRAITEGDILRPGACPVNPRIQYRYSDLGLFVNPVDDLNALDRITEAALCYPDCNGDGELNLADFGCFQTRFALSDPYADCNGDGQLNLADFGCFQTQFALGCP